MMMKMVQMVLSLIPLPACVIAHQEFGGNASQQCLSFSTPALAKGFRNIFVVLNLKNSLDKFYVVCL